MKATIDVSMKKNSLVTKLLSKNRICYNLIGFLLSIILLFNNVIKSFFL